MSKRSTIPIPPRVAARHDPALWQEDELLTLPEAAALLWPCGLLKTRNLRWAQKTGRLATVTLSGKMFTTRRALAQMAICAFRPQPEEDDNGPPPSFDDLVNAKLATLGLPPKK